ncbi:MAG: alanine racemase [bacterium]|nr:alanine racemase [bacterium]
MNKGPNNGVRTWIEVDKKALKNNYKLFRNLLSRKTGLMAVVKSNAYGHGLVDYSRAVSKLGADWLGVDSIVEGKRLREEGVVTPILVLGFTLTDKVNEAVNNDISVTVSNFDLLKKLPRILQKQLRVHIKVDTGMHRQGLLPHEMKPVVQFLKKNKKLIRVEGLYTHFSSAKNPSFPSTTRQQLAVFKKWTSAFNEAGFKPLIHAAATGAAILFPESHFDMVRVGIGLYGLWPSKETQAFAERKLRIKPILAWKTVVSEVKKFKNPVKIGYDLTEELPPNSTIAICPIGYWHGFPRSLSSTGQVLVGGKRAKVIGKVSMDMIAIDVTGISGVRSGSEVVIIGSQGGDTMSADRVADLADTVNYEILTRINPLIRKIYR